VEGQFVVPVHKGSINMTDVQDAYSVGADEEERREINDFDFGRVAGLLGIIEKIATVAPMNNNIMGVAQAELQLLNDQAKKIADNRAKRQADAAAKLAADQQAKEAERQAVVEQEAKRIAEEQALAQAKIEAEKVVPPVGGPVSAPQPGMPFTPTPQPEPVEPQPEAQPEEPTNPAPKPVIERKL
jgi:cell division protein FtsN